MALKQEKLVLSIVTKLRADTGSGSLVDLTGHTSSKHHISRGRPKVAERSPFLGVVINESVPLVPMSITHLQKARVHFWCSAKSELTAIRIADRLEALLDWKVEDDGARSPVGFYDFSSDPNGIQNRSTRFKNRDEPIHDADTDSWEILVEADLVWLDQPCS